MLKVCLLVMCVTLAGAVHTAPNGKRYLLAASCTGIVKSPVPTDIATRLKLDTNFYKKYVEAVGGIAVLGSAKVSDAALLKHAMVINRMLKPWPAVAHYMGDVRLRATVMAESEITTDVPEHSKNSELNWARGLGSTCGSLTSSAAEENVLCYTNDRYRGNNIGVHEFAHSMSQDGLQYIFETNGLWKEQQVEFAKKNQVYYDKTYSNTNFVEFWAQASQSYFDCSTGHPEGGKSNNADFWTRDMLKNLNPSLFNLLDRTYQSTYKVRCPTKTGFWANTYEVDCSDFWQGSAKRTTPFTNIPCGLMAGLPDNCKDEDTNCNYWSSIGECTKAPAFMQKTCKYSCKFCKVATKVPTPPPTSAAGTDCKDDNASCQGWANGGECSKNPGYMLGSCKLSCKVCVPIAVPTARPTPSPPTPAPASPTPSTSGDCKDDNIYCQDWASKGECSKNPGYMLGSCKLSCKVCVPPAQEVCKDDSTKCAGWARNGECTKNPAFMTQSCPLSCKLCQPTKPSAAVQEATVEVFDTSLLPNISVPLSPDLPFDAYFGCVDSLPNNTCQTYAAAGKCSSIAVAKQCLHSCPTDVSSPADCAAAVAAGMCEKNPVEWNTKCRRSCIRDVEVTNGKCSAWAQQGKCSTHAPYMIAYCRKSCNVCPSSAVVMAIQNSLQAISPDAAGLSGEDFHFPRPGTTQSPDTTALNAAVAFPGIPLWPAVVALVHVMVSL